MSKKTVLFCIVSTLAFCFRPAALPAKEPTKQDLIKTLQQFHELLAAKNYAEAAQMIVVPEGFNPERLSTVIERKEISPVGIRVLQKAGKFGKAASVFEKDRATHFAERANVDVEKCYGFNHGQGGEFGEVVAIWEGESFRLVRVDDVGKLADTAAASPKQPTKEDLLKLLPALKAAVAEKPEDVPARARYAQVLFRLGNLPEAWKQLQAARKLDPKHVGVARGYEQVFVGFEKKGLFTVGVPAATIKDILGDPDRVVELSWGKRWLYFYYAVEMVDDRVHETVNLRGAKEEWFKPSETVKIDLDGRGWRCNIRRKVNGLVTALFHPAGQSITKWDEQFEIERIVGGARAGEPKDLGPLLVKQLTGRVPGAQAKVLNTTDDSVFVAAFFPMPEGKPRHQLIRLIRADKDVHRISYAIRTKELDEPTQKKWYAILASATLKPVAAP